MNILLKSAKIIDKNSPFHLQKIDILIEKGRISKIAKNISELKGVKKVSLDNLHVSCGWFDTSVSFGEPGYEERETIENGLQVAAKSGFTAVALNPNTNPVIDSKSIVEFLKIKAKGHLVDLHPIANLTKNCDGLELAELYDMKNSGAIAFGDYNNSLSKVDLMKIALQYAQNFDGLILNFPQENAIAVGSVNEGENAIKIGLKGSPALAEEMQITRDLFLLEYTGGKLHIPCITTAKSVDLIQKAKKKGLDVTCSVSAHHLFLTDDELHDFNTNFKVLPPLRTKKDVKALQKAVEKGQIDCIVSDHNPIDIEHKKVPFELAKYGTIGLESLFGALSANLDLEALINCLTTNPRKRFGLEAVKIDLGEKANLTLFNPSKTYIFKEDHIQSTSKNSAFLNKNLKGIVYGVYANKKIQLNK
jgi:dihydroorotase